MDILDFAKALAREGAEEGINVNSIAPGPMTTEIRKGLPDKIEKATWQTIPMKRLGLPEEGAFCVAFPVAGEAGYMTGEDIDINGGSHID